MKESIEVEIDRIIDALTEGDDFSEEGKLGVERLRESWRKARELIVDNEMRTMLLAEYRQILSERLDT
jgi:hypothetical protein